MASAHGESKYWGYTSAFNLLDYSASVFPVRTVRETDTVHNYPTEQETPLNDTDALFKEFYTGPAKYRGAPINLQLVSRRYREESVLDMTEIVMAALEGEATAQKTDTDGTPNWKL